ncbi:cytochrome P450 [Kitasatospora sp. NPDC093102]|uniref:cytochrome P450 n=1 Tax=Kitasatospora sp. NPDC093102 TaxID=3155069 RepID=UPI003447FA12
MTTPALDVPVAPGRLPLVGHGWQLWRRPRDFIGSLPSLGPVVRLDVGSWPVYFLTDHELIHHLVVAQSHSVERGRIFKRLGPILGNGLATSEGELHRRQRRLMQPAFHHSRIERYARIMGENVRRLAASWQPGQVLAVDREMYRLVTTTVADVMFSSSLSGAAVAELVDAVPVVSNSLFYRAVVPRTLESLPIPVNRRFDAAAARLHHLIDGIIRERRESGDTYGDLLSMLLSARDAETGEPMADAQVHDEAVTILFTGTETTATTLAWAFHELARHPEVERRVRAEVDAVAGDGPIGLAEVPKLTYTDQVLREVVRLHSLLLLMRRTTAPVRLRDTVVPAGTELAYSLYGLHRDPGLYPDPTRFDPDRWSPERAGSLPRSAYLPFSAGSHKCIGDSFAWTEALIFLATLVSTWRLRPLPGSAVREVPAAIPKPDALPMVVEHRPPYRGDRTSGPQPSPAETTIRQEQPDGP